LSSESDSDPVGILDNPDSPGHHTDTISDEQDEKELDKVLKGMVIVLLT
jgi:hypothetical protein